VRFAERPGTDPTKRAIREIVGVDPRLTQRWSTRRASINVRRSALAIQFQSDHGRPPTAVEALQPAQQATLETRDAKHCSREPDVTSRGPSVAPSAAAAAVLSEQTGIQADTLAKLTWAIEHSKAPDWAAQVRRSTLIIIDKAGMADTLSLDAAVQFAVDRGASVRLVG
jgi:hypothetical protein